MKTRKLLKTDICTSVTEENIKAVKTDKNLRVMMDESYRSELEAGLRIRGKEYNIFVCGPPGSQKYESVVEVVNSIKAEGNFSRQAPVYRVHKMNETEAEIIADKTDSKSFPAVTENHPTPARLFGTTAKNIQDIRPGSLHKSSGGVLILRADDLIAEEESWDLLKRTLRTGMIEPVSPKTSEGFPEAGTFDVIPFYADLKIIIIGTENQFDLFYATDEDFRDSFQFFVETDAIIPLNEVNLEMSVNIFRNHAENICGKSLSDSAALELVKHSISLAENRDKLSTSINEILPVITEASERFSGSGEIDADSIKKTLSAVSGRYNLLERRILEDIKCGELNLKVDGSEVGKVNGLAILDKGPYSFGIPGLISARIAPGESGLVNIEHEAGLSGEIHDKWVLILEGFLRGSFARDFPISIFASLCFEQSYSEIDGDSASSSELYALLSAITGVPLRQDIAVTGSLSQTGEIQAVGGLREKIEGFYKVCRTINFTGNQGVIVPEKNIKNIILPDEILDDIENEKFHIYPVETVDDSIEILTGMTAGKRNARGIFPAGTFNSLVEKKLKQIAMQAKNFGN